MKILIVGSGGREHAMLKAVKRSPKVREILVAPGNPGMEREARLVKIAVDDIAGLTQLAKEENIDLTLVGPELPLTLGIVDAFNKEGLKVFGPTEKAAILEASKVYSKNFFKKYHIPTASYEIFSDADKAIAFLKKHADKRWVIKADGLAAGKGAIVTSSIEEAIEAVGQILIDRTFGQQEVVIEEFLEGEELSFMVISDGQYAAVLASSQDHKRLLDGDQGPNTGGMGAYSPAPLMTEALSETVMKQVIYPTIHGMASEGRAFQGVLYAGLMIVDGKPYVLEYNVRLGDPEAQVILPRLESDYVEFMMAALAGDLKNFPLKWKNESAVCVVLASHSYPVGSRKGDVIEGLEMASQGATVYHAGTAKSSHHFVTAGGRVLGVTALGEDLPQAVKRCYQAVGAIHFDGMQYRRDIAAKGLGKVGS